MRAIPFPFAAAIASNVSEVVPIELGSIGASFEYPSVAAPPIRAGAVRGEIAVSRPDGCVGPDGRRPPVAADRARQSRVSRASTCSGAMP